MTGGTDERGGGRATGAPAATVLAEFGAGLEYEALPAEVVRTVCLRLVDTAGVCLAGVGMDYAAAIAEVVREHGGPPEAAVLGRPFRAPASWAALHNSALAHGNDYDDTHSVALVHPSGIVIPTVLAVGERVGASGAQAIAAAVAGYEVALRIGLAAPTGFHARGFHATGICGTFAAAVAAGRLLGLSAAQLAHAIGIAGSQAAGSMEFLSDGAWTKRMHPGWAAHAGIIAALLAAKGYTGPATVLEGRYGVFSLYAAPAVPDLDRLTAGLGTEWEVLNVAYKPYPCGHISHPYMDCAARLRQRFALKPDDIEAIELRVPTAGVAILCEPLADKKRPTSGYAAKFSLPYSVAVVLVRGQAGIDEFSEEAIGDPTVLALAARTTYVVDDTLPFPRYFPGWVGLRLRDGRHVEERIDSSRGSREYPMTDDELQEKFVSNARRAVSGDTAKAIWTAGQEFDRLRVSDFTRLLAR